MASISVLIADDHLLLREAMVNFLGQQPGFMAVAAGCLGDALTRMKNSGPFGVALLEVGVFGDDGLTGVDKAIAANSGGAVALMSGEPRRNFVEAALQRGVRGHIPKSLPAQTVAEALRQIAAGRIYLPVDHDRPATNVLPAALAHLSPQEGRVLRHLCQGLSNKEIARAMNLAEITVKIHMRAVCTKLEARNRTHAALIGNAHLRGQ